MLKTTEPRPKTPTGSTRVEPSISDHFSCFPMRTLSQFTSHFEFLPQPCFNIDCQPLFTEDMSLPMTSELVEQLEQSKMEPCGKDEDVREGELTRLEDYSKYVSQTVMDASDSSIDTKPLDEMKEWNWRYFDVAAHPDHSEGIETCLNAMLQRRTILLKMNIKLPCKNGSKAKEGTIVIRETDNVKTVVEGFSKQHNLPSESSNYLMKVVSEALADVRKKGNDVVGCGDEENGPVMPDGTITAMRRNAESYSVRSGGRLGRKGSEVRGSGSLSRTPSSTPMSTLSPRRTVSSDFQSTQYPRSTMTAELIDPLGEQIEEEREAEMKEMKNRKEVKKRRKTKGSPLRKKEGKKESFFERSQKHEEKRKQALEAKKKEVDDEEVKDVKKDHRKLSKSENERLYQEWEKAHEERKEREEAYANRPLDAAYTFHPEISAKTQQMTEHRTFHDATRPRDIDLKRLEAGSLDDSEAYEIFKEGVDISEEEEQTHSPFISPRSEKLAIRRNEKIEQSMLRENEVNDEQDDDFENSIRYRQDEEGQQEPEETKNDGEDLEHSEHETETDAQQNAMESAETSESESTPRPEQLSLSPTTSQNTSQFTTPTDQKTASTDPPDSEDDYSRSASRQVPALAISISRSAPREEIHTARTNRTTRTSATNRTTQTNINSMLERFKYEEEQRRRRLEERKQEPDEKCPFQPTLFSKTSGSPSNGISASNRLYMTGMEQKRRKESEIAKKEKEEQELAEKRRKKMLKSKPSPKTEAHLVKLAQGKVVLEQKRDERESELRAESAKQSEVKASPQSKRIVDERRERIERLFGMLVGGNEKEEKDEDNEREQREEDTQQQTQQRNETQAEQEDKQTITLTPELIETCLKGKFAIDFLVLCGMGEIVFKTDSDIRNLRQQASKDRNSGLSPKQSADSENDKNQKLNHNEDEATSPLQTAKDDVLGTPVTSPRTATKKSPKSAKFVPQPFKQKKEEIEAPIMVIRSASWDEYVTPKGRFTIAKRNGKEARGGHEEMDKDAFVRFVMGRIKQTKGSFLSLSDKVEAGAFLVNYADVVEYCVEKKLIMERVSQWDLDASQVVSTRSTKKRGFVDTH